MASLTADPVTGDFLLNQAFNTESGVRAGRLIVIQALQALKPSRDFDHDKVDDGLDNCPDTFNPDQRDSNLNGFGDACETPDLRQSAAFFQALPDGSTTKQAWS